MKLIAELKALVKKETAISIEILKRLRQVEDSMLYARMGYSSMHDFCVRELKYPDGSADRRIKAMRLIKDVPAAEEKILSGEINLTTAAAAQRTFTEAKKQNVEMDKEEILDNLAGASTREADKILREESVKAGIAEEDKDPDFKQKVKALLAHFSHAHPGLKEDGLFRLLVEKTYTQIDPKRERRKSGVQKSQNEEARRPSAATRREVFVRDEGQCTFVSTTGRRCTATHFLEPDHIVPFAKGGLTKTSNLRLRCRAHNRLAAIEEGLPQPRNSGAGVKKRPAPKSTPAPEQSPLFH